MPRRRSWNKCGRCCRRPPAQDAKTVVANASKAMGVDGLNSITTTARARTATSARTTTPTSRGRGRCNDYVRAIDFTQPASRATWLNYAVPVTGGAAVQGHAPAEHHAGQHGVGAAARDLDHAVGLPQGRRRQQRHGASADGQRQALQVVTFNAPAKSPGGQPYRVVGYISAATWWRGCRRGWRTRSSATCSSRPTTSTIATPTA